MTYSISGGADSALFSINGTTGALSFNAAPNYEAPTDAGANNVYDVTVRASDGTFAATQAIAVTVTNVAEPPTASGENLVYVASSAASSISFTRMALFGNDAGESDKTTWTVGTVTNTPTGGTATTFGNNITVSGFDTGASDTFTYTASDAGGQSAPATVTVLRTTSTTVTGTAASDILVGATSAVTFNGGAGKDYLIGGNNADTLTGGADADDLTGSVGADTFVFAEGSDGVAPTAVNFALGSSATTVDNGDTLTFGNGVDIVRDFVSGTDTLDVTTAGNATALAGQVNTTALAAGNNYWVRGTYNEVSKTFVVLTSSGSDLLVIQGGGIAPNGLTTETDFIVLIGVTSVAAADFV